jgi:hypothetical protein
MPVGRAPFIAGDDANSMPAFSARARRRGFHHARESAVNQRCASARNFAPDFERELADCGGSVAGADNGHDQSPLHHEIYS